MRGAGEGGGGTGGLQAGVCRDRRAEDSIFLRDKVVELAHSSHQGIVKTKALIRSRICFPGNDREVEDRGLRYRLCQANEPMMPSSMPSGPWECVSADFFGPMDDGKYFFLICANSRVMRSSMRFRRWRSNLF